MMASTLVPAGQRAAQRGLATAQVRFALATVFSEPDHVQRPAPARRPSWKSGRSNPPPNSYTARLYQGGVSKIGSKIEEEAREVVEAAGEPGEPGRRHLIYESSDLIYHLLVMLAHQRRQVRGSRGRNRPPLRPVGPGRKSRPHGDGREVDADR